MTLDELELVASVNKYPRGNGVIDEALYWFASGLVRNCGGRKVESRNIWADLFVPLVYKVVVRNQP